MKRAGFTLIELMIVVAILFIIAAIAIPSMLRSRMAANEVNAIGSVRTIFTAEIQYKNSGLDTTNSINQYGTLDALNNANPPFLDSVLGTEGVVKAGYIFVSSLSVGSSTAPPRFEIRSSSLGDNNGTRNFYIDEEGVIFWVKYPAIPTSTDTPL